jgi:hypothetical protein
MTDPGRAGRAVAGVLLAAVLSPGAAGAAPILLPSVRTTLTPGPPLVGTTSPPAETRVPSGTTSVQRVLVGVDGTGKPVSVAVVQRLRLTRLGDYSFVVPGPIEAVEGAAGSDSEPGLRRDAVIWAGFSPGKKTLGARITLRPAPAARLLPLRLTLTRSGDALLVRGENVTGAPGPVLVGQTDPAAAAAALDATRRDLPLGSAAPDLFIEVPRTPSLRTQRIYAPLEVRGEVAGRRFVRRLGDGAPLSFELRVPNAPRNARLRLVVTPSDPERTLTPPGGAPTWVEALRRGRVRAARLLARLSRARLTVARSVQYRTYLSNPDPRGRGTATYLYATAGRKAASAPAPQAGGTSRGRSWGALALAAAVAVVAAGGLVVLWSHS